MAKKRSKSESDIQISGRMTPTKDDSTVTPPKSGKKDSSPTVEKDPPPVTHGYDKLSNAIEEHGFKSEEDFDEKNQSETHQTKTPLSKHKK